MTRRLRSRDPSGRIFDRTEIEISEAWRLSEQSGVVRSYPAMNHGAGSCWQGFALSCANRDKVKLEISKRNILDGVCTERGGIHDGKVS